MDNRPHVNFQRKRVGKKIDMDGYPTSGKYQCVDLFKLYARDVLGIKYTKTGDAKEIWKNKYKVFDSKRTQIKGMNDLMQGDIILSVSGSFGHIGVVDSISSNGVNVLEQNGSGMNSGNGKGANAVRVHNYPFSFRAGVWRCQKIFDNLELERKFINNKLTESEAEIAITNSYKQSIRYTL